MKYQKELHTALTAARKGGRYVKANWGAASINNFKGSYKDYATKQDIQSNQIIVDIIKKSFPDDYILSEELCPGFEDHDRMWIVDPIDGTRNFAHGIPNFCVSIALWEGGKIRVGAVYAPCLNNELFHAVHGQGAFLNGKRLPRLRPRVALKSSIVATGFFYHNGKELTFSMKHFPLILNKATDMIRSGSAALDLCNVAAGRLGAYYESGIKPWDVAAGCLMITEQKGLYTDYAGNSLDIFRGRTNGFAIEILAAKNRRIHGEIVDILTS